MDESHLEKVKKDIETLEQLKQTDSKSFSTWLRSLGSSKQQETPPNDESGQCDQSKEIHVRGIIKDFKEKVRNLETTADHLVQEFSQHFDTETSKKKKAETLVLQVYERDGNTSDFVTSFQERIDTKYQLYVVENVSKIAVEKPLLVLCRIRGRLNIDIDYSMELIHNVKSISRLGIVLIHSKEEHALPTTSSQSKIGGEEQFKGVWIIDTAYTKELKFYDCDMNKKASDRLKKFLTE